LRGAILPGQAYEFHFPLACTPEIVAKKVEHDLVDLRVVAVGGVLAGADDFVEIEAWVEEKLDWFRRNLTLENGIPSHETFGRVFAVINAKAFSAEFRRWVSRVIPRLAQSEVVSLDGKVSRRSGTPLHLVSAFAASVNLVRGQQATATLADRCVSSHAVPSASWMRFKALLKGRF